jgi:hypothetical protein
MENIRANLLKLPYVKGASLTFDCRQIPPARIILYPQNIRCKENSNLPVAVADEGMQRRLAYK